MSGRNADTLKLIARAQEILGQSPTVRQIEVLQLIESGRRRDGYPPTIRELCAQLKVSSTQAVACHLAALQRKGFVTWTAHRGRTLAVTTKGRTWLPRGRMSMGKPVPAAVVTRIRALAANEPELTLVEIGQRFALSGFTIKRILRGSRRKVRKGGA